MKFPFDKVYILHVASHKDRLLNIKKEFEKINCSDYEIWWAVKRPWIKNVKESYPNLATDFYCHNTKDELQSVFNCSLEHYSIIKQAYERGFDSVMIVEDDISFTNDIAFLKETLKSLPNDFDLIKFGCAEYHNNRNYEKAIVIADENFIKLGVKDKTADNGKHYGAYGYALSRNGMKFIIDSLDKEINVIDVLFGEMFEKYNCYYTNKPILYHEWLFGSSIV